MLISGSDGGISRWGRDDLGVMEPVYEKVFFWKSFTRPPKPPAAAGDLFFFSR